MQDGFSSFFLSLLQGFDNILFLTILRFVQCMDIETGSITVLHWALNCVCCVFLGQLSYVCPELGFLDQTQGMQ